MACLMDVTTMQHRAQRHAVLEARYRAIKDGKMPLWRLIWEVLRPRYTSARRLRNAQRADVERLRAKLQQGVRT